MYQTVLRKSLSRQFHSCNSTKAPLEDLPKLVVQNKYKSKGSAYNFKPQKVEPGVYYQPSPSIPSPLQKTPNAFLPQNDARKSNLPEYTAKDISYMPPLKEPSEKKYHLTAKEVEEIKQLRKEDPYKNTRKVLAAKYGCSEFFIGMVADNTEARVADMNSRLEQIKSMWSEKRKQGKVDKQKRQQWWYRA